MAPDLSYVIPDHIPPWVWLVVLAIEFAAVLVVFYVMSQPR